MTQRICVLIDDDFLVHMTWRMAAEKVGVNLFTFYTEAEFTSQIGSLPYSCELYIDKNLAEGIDGIEIAKRASNLGFQNIFLATGSDFLLDEVQKHFPFIKGIIQKSPPF